MTSKKTLVILAAGLGSRYGGLKQVESFGPAGESLMDYAVFDAVKAGFDSFLLVIKDELVPFIEKKLNSPLYRNLACDFVLQDMQDVPKQVEGRKKPWGTGHAVYACRKKIQGSSFSVINADDFYGRQSFKLLSSFLSSPQAAIDFAMVGFRLANTLSIHGGVSRGVCVLDQGKLCKIEEKIELKKNAAGEIHDKFGQGYSGDEIVSMNCWAFSPQIFQAIEQEIETLFDRPEHWTTHEIMLPSAVQRSLKQGTKVEVFLSESPSFGITFLEDKKIVQEKILELCQKKHYPHALHDLA